MFEMNWSIPEMSIVKLHFSPTGIKYMGVGFSDVMTLFSTVNGYENWRFCSLLFADVKRVMQIMVTAEMIIDKIG